MVRGTDPPPPTHTHTIIFRFGGINSYGTSYLVVKRRRDGTDRGDFSIPGKYFKIYLFIIMGGALSSLHDGHFYLINKYAQRSIIILFSITFKTYKKRKF